MGVHRECELHWFFITLVLMVVGTLLSLPKF